MPFPVTSGPAFGSNSTSKAIPQIWAAKLVEKFYAATVYKDISNTDYEGSIKKFGDTVIIRTRATVTVQDYAKNPAGGLNYEQPESANVALDIDQGKYFALNHNLIEQIQSDINLMDEWSKDAAEQVGISIDQDILQSIYTNAAAENSGATAGVGSSNIDLGTAAAPLTLTTANVTTMLLRYNLVLDKQNVPNSNRYVVLPPEAIQLIKGSDLKDASLSGDSQSLLRNTNGLVGMIDRLKVYSSNNLRLDSGQYDVIFGHKCALTFAMQAMAPEELKNPNDFGDLYRELCVYGFEVIKPDSLGHSVIEASVV